MSAVLTGMFSKCPWHCSLQSESGHHVSHFSSLSCISEFDIFCACLFSCWKIVFAVFQKAHIKNCANKRSEIKEGAFRTICDWEKYRLILLSVALLQARWCFTIFHLCHVENKLVCQVFKSFYSQWHVHHDNILFPFSPEKGWGQSPNKSLHLML